MTHELDPRNSLSDEDRKFFGHRLVSEASLDPFVQTLLNLAESRGYTTQCQLADDLDASNAIVSSTFRGHIVPSIRLFCRFLQILKPETIIEDQLVVYYKQSKARHRERLHGSRRLRAAAEGSIAEPGPFKKKFENKFPVFSS